MPPGSLITVAELLPAWLTADHPWKPSTVVGYRSTVKAPLNDAVANERVLSLSPQVVRDLLAGWARAGVSPAVTAARIRGLRSTVGWAWDERILEVHPVRFRRGPARVPPRRLRPDHDVRVSLAPAELRLLEAHATTPCPPHADPPDPGSSASDMLPGGDG